MSREDERAQRRAMLRSLAMSARAQHETVRAILSGDTAMKTTSAQTAPNAPQPLRG